MSNNLFILITLLFFPQLAWANDSMISQVLLVPLLILQIFVIWLNFNSDRSSKDKWTLIIIYAVIMWNPWNHYFQNGMSVYLKAAFLLAMQYVMYRALLIFENRIAQVKK